MIGSTYLRFAAVALASFVSASVVEQDWVLALLKRQEPGTPLYACHDSCGNSITLSRGADPCNNDAFVTQYEYCLTCAGPDKLNIWRYYGATLTTAGTKCGFSTTPGVPTPTEPEEPEPVTTTTPSVPSPTPVTSSTTTTPPVETPTTTTTPSPETPVSETSSATVSASVTASASSATITASATSSTIVIPIGTASSGLPTTTPGPQFTGAANAQHVVGLGALGAAVFALLI